MTPHSIKVARLQVPSEVSARQSDVGVTGVSVEVVLGTEFSFATGET